MENTLSCTVRDVQSTTGKLRDMPPTAGALLAGGVMSSPSGVGAMGVQGADEDTGVPCCLKAVVLLCCSLGQSWRGEGTEGFGLLPDVGQLGDFRVTRSLPGSRTNRLECLVDEATVPEMPKLVGFVGARLVGFVGARLVGFVGARLVGFVGARLVGFVGARLVGFVGARLVGFVGARLVVLACLDCAKPVKVVSLELLALVDVKLAALVCLDGAAEPAPVVVCLISAGSCGCVV